MVVLHRNVPHAGGRESENDMGAYESFARVYDLFMDNVPYEEWGSYLTGLLRGIRHLQRNGCGTGVAAPEK